MLLDWDCERSGHRRRHLPSEQPHPGRQRSGPCSNGPAVQGDDDARVVAREDSALASHFSTDIWHESLLAGAPGSRGRRIPRSEPTPDDEPEVPAQPYALRTLI